MCLLLIVVKLEAGCWKPEEKSWMMGFLKREASYISPMPIPVTWHPIPDTWNPEVNLASI
jgi:hypothetical protein